MEQQMNYLDRIVPRLYIGDSHAGRTEQLLIDRGITVSINVAKDLDDPWMKTVKCVKFGLVDGESSENTPSLYYVAALSALNFIKLGESVLIHCHEGKSRSVAIATLVISQKHGLSLEDSFSLIKTFRPQVAMKQAHIQYVEEAYKLFKEKKK